MKSNVWTVRNWSSPASSYPDRSFGNASLETAHYKRGYYDCYGIGGFKFYRLLRRTNVKNLYIGGSVWMVDDPVHWLSIQEHAADYHGHVLVAGLGLGLIVHALDANPSVDKITVIEIESDVIELVLPLVPQKKLNIICGDFFDHHIAVDGIFFDLFVGDGPALFPAALRVYFQLAEHNPTAETIRIFGFPNKVFDGVRAAAQQASQILR